AWAGARMDGIILTLQIVEAEPIPPRPDKSKPSDVVAKKDGIIEKVTPLSGKSNVKPGDAVRAGDILIRGDITREGAAEPMYVFAEGEALAQVWYTSSVTLPCTEEQLLRSGQSEPFRVIEIAGLPLFRTESGFKQFEEEVIKESAQRGLILPLNVRNGVRYELTMQQVPAEADQVVAEALFRAELAALEQVPKEAQIIKKVSESAVLEDGGIHAVVAVCTLEQIGVVKPMYGS
ncbi:MAG TPA: sporulation protein YqfD, partial [Feifaniaceae bacterium]|nr:sporulation protein YqfD [Feifaniaceae bacterium]